MSEVKTESTSDFKTGFSLWISFCIFICIWFLSHFMRGRRQLQNNLHVIEDGLRRMQDEIDRRQRENSIGYGEDLQRLTEEHLKKVNKENLQDEDKKSEDSQAKVAKSCDNDKDESVANSSTVQDKKND